MTKKQTILVIGNTGLVPALLSLDDYTVVTAGSMEVGGAKYTLFYDHPVLLQQIIDDAFTIGQKIDLILYMDDGNLPWVIGIEERNIPALFYSVDTFCNPWHIPFARLFDFALVAQKDHVGIFNDEGARAFWFPLFCKTSLLCDINNTDWQERSIPLAFVGTLDPKNIPQRKPFLEEVKKYQPIIIRQGNFQPIFNNSRIVLNQSAASEVNYRVFEAMACGAVLLNESIGHGLNDLFTVGIDILPTYEIGNAKMAAYISKEYLSQPQLLEEIAKNAWKKVAEQHTDIHRTKSIAQLFQESIKNKLYIKNENTHKIRCRASHDTYGILISELAYSLPIHTKFFKNLYEKEYNIL